MSRLAGKLKQIYSSSSSYTVLQLLDKMIKVVEEYEAEHPMYEHRIAIYEGVLPVTTFFVTIYNFSETPITTFEEITRGDRIAGSGYAHITSPSDEYVALAAVSGPTTVGQFTTMTFYGNNSAGYLTRDVANLRIVDTVKEIKE